MLLFPQLKLNFSVKWHFILKVSSVQPMRWDWTSVRDTTLLKCWETWQRRMMETGFGHQLNKCKSHIPGEIHDSHWTSEQSLGYKAIPHLHGDPASVTFALGGGFENAIQLFMSCHCQDPSLSSAANHAHVHAGGRFCPCPWFLSTFGALSLLLQINKTSLR